MDPSRSESIRVDPIRVDRRRGLGERSPVSDAIIDDLLARDLVARTGCAFLMVTHSARLAATLDRRVMLHAGVIT